MIGIDGRNAQKTAVEAMKSNAPWSVKGIERDARETAKEAAKREGMTVGEWLNQMIYSAGDPENTDGEIEGLKLRDLVTAIEHLHKRIADADQKGVSAVEEINRNIGGAVERIQRLERVKPQEGTYDDLAARVARVEEAAGDRQRVEALKALEKAVAQVAVQFNNAQKASQERLDATEQQVQQLAARIDENSGGDNDGILFLKNAIDGLSIRITRAEKIATEASNLKHAASESADPEFVESTGNRLRVLGDEIKRGGDQIKSMENAIARLSDQVEAAERRSSEGVQKVAETISAVRDELDSGNSAADLNAALEQARRETDERIARLQNSFEDMLSKLTALDASQEAGATSVMALAQQETEQAAPQAPADVMVADDDEVISPEAFGFDDAEEEMAAPVADDDSEIEELTAAQRIDEPASSDGEEDPFAFADEIDSEFDAPSEASNESDENLFDEAAPDATHDASPEPTDEADDFSFEFDDGDDAAQAVDDKQANEGQSLLDEVQQAFGRKEPANTAPENGEDELDAILADLDDISGAGKTAKLDAAAPPRITAPVGDEAESAEGEDDGDADGDKKDFVKVAREKAKAAAAKRELDEKKRAAVRRKLTPKQRAILAARAKQKLKAKKEAEQEATPTAPDNDVVSDADLVAPPPDSKSKAQDSAENTGPLGKAKSLLSGVTARFKKKDDDDDAITANDAGDGGAKNSADATTQDAEPSRNGDRAAFATLKSTAAARPVALALGVAIFLAFAALFFLVKDLVLKSDAPERTTATVTETTSPAAAPDSDLPAVPAAPAIDPRELYLTAMTELEAASTDEATAEAIQTLQEAAALGHPPAQLQLGEFYKTGQGVEQDLGQARTWFRRSANGGNVLAMHRIGVMTARGDGGPADSSEAIGWFELAGNRGLVDSQYNLGAIYHPNAENPAAIQDPALAYFWYSLAGKNGDEQAVALASGLVDQLSAEQRASIDAEISAWEPDASDPIANEVTPPSE